jgi:hypothetical protein
LTLVKIKDVVPVVFNLNIPPNSNYKVALEFKCVDVAGQFGQIQSAKILSMGRNIDGLMREYKAGRILSVSNKSGIGESYYYDSIKIDLGIITNTSYYYLSDGF